MEESADFFSGDGLVVKGGSSCEFFEVVDSFSQIFSDFGYVIKKAFGCFGKAFDGLAEDVFFNFGYIEIFEMSAEVGFGF